MLINGIRQWWWKRCYPRFYCSDANANPYAMNAETEQKFQLLVQELQNVLRPSPNDTVVDLGGGNGRLAAGVFRGCSSVTIVDFCLEAMGQPIDGLFYVVGDIKQPPIADGRCTVVFSHSVLPHLASERAVIELLARWDALVCEGGLLYIGDIPDRQAFKRTVLLTFHKLPNVVVALKYLFAVTMANYFSRHRLQRALERLGYTTRSIEQSPNRRFWHERFDVLARKPLRRRLTERQTPSVEIHAA